VWGSAQPPRALMAELVSRLLLSLRERGTCLDLGMGLEFSLGPPVQIAQNSLLKFRAG
jgi:hypothetical protein